MTGWFEAGLVLGALFGYAGMGLAWYVSARRKRTRTKP